MPDAIITNDLRNRLVVLTRDLILIKSTDNNPEERARCFEFIANHLEAHESLQVRLLEDGGYTSMVILPKGIENPDVLFCGHIDVIEHPQLKAYHSKIDDGRIVGPGAGDMKGAVAIMLELLRSLHRKHPGISVGMAITSDEERGGEHGVRYLVDEAGLRCGIAIIPDGGSLSEITLEEKGILHLRLHASGEAAHAARPWLGENAIEKLTARLSALIQHFELKRPKGAIERGDHWFPTCNLSMISTPNRTINRVPSNAEAILDVRFPPPLDSNAVLEEIRGLLGDGIEVETIISAESTHLDADPLFFKVTEEITGTTAHAVKASGGSDGRFFRNHGIPVNLSRPLVGNLHAEDEWIDIESMLTYHEICRSYIERRLGSESPAS